MNDSLAGRTSAPALTDFILLNEEIAALVRARMPIESHLRQIGAELPAKAGQLADSVSRRLAAGQSLPAAIDAECASMPAVYRATMLAGLDNGRFGSAIESIVDTASRLDDLRRITGAALLYPLVVVAVASTLFAVVATRVAPRFDWLQHSQFGAISWLANYPRAVELTAVAVPILMALIVAIWWWRSGRLKTSYPTRFGVMNWIPGAGRVRYWSETATFAELLLLLVESNVPLDHALRLTAEASADRSLRAAAERVADRIQHGHTAWPSDASELRRSRHEFPLLIRLALYHASNRELLTGGLRQAAVLYRERAVRAAEWYAEYVPILLTAGFGGVLTLAFTVAVLWPYASALRELSQAGRH